MSRTVIANQIPDLMIEWASSSPNTSVRDFVINQKGFTPRQYKHIMARTPVADWKCRREEIQNQIAAQRISRHIDEAVELNTQYVKAAKLSLARSLNELVKLDAVPSKSIDLLNLIKGVEISQKIFNSAMGVPLGEGLCHLVAELGQMATQKPQPIKQSNGWESELTYDQVLECIEFRQKMKEAAKLNRLKNQGDLNSLK